MEDEEDRDLMGIVEVGEERVELLFALCIDPVCRFVKCEDMGVSYECTSNQHPLLLASRQVGEEFPGDPAKPGLGDCFVHCRPVLRCSAGVKMPDCP